MSVVIPIGGNVVAELVEPEEQPVQDTFFCADGVFVRRIRVQKAFTVIPQHYHAHDHNTLLAAGSVRVWKSAKRHGEMEPDETAQLQLIGDFSADDNDMILIEAGRYHQFMTLTDNVKICCLHNTHGEDAEVIIAQAPALLK